MNGDLPVGQATLLKLRRMSMTPAQCDREHQRVAYNRKMQHNTTVHTWPHARAILQGMIAEAARYAKRAFPGTYCNASFYAAQTAALQELHDLSQNGQPPDLALRYVVARVSSMQLYRMAGHCKPYP